MSLGDDPHAHLRAHLARVARSEFEGTWATIELQPDVFARQRYTVGVVVCDGNGRFQFRLLDDLRAFDCWYRANEVAALRSLINSAEQSLLRAQQEEQPLGRVTFAADSVGLGQLWATSGRSLEEVLVRLYFDVVPFVPRDEVKDQAFVGMDTPTVRAQVSAALKRIAGLAFDQIVTALPETLMADHETGVTHRLEFNLAPPGKVGTVISAVYKTPATVELNYLRASTDLATVRSLRGRDIQPGIFVMQPAQGSMPPSDLARIEHILDEQSWRLEQQDFVVSTHDNAGMLAQDILEWSDLRAT